MESSTSKLIGARRLEGMYENVWVEFAGLARQYQPVNLGQGFPDLPVPPFLRDSMMKAIQSSDMNHQYTRGWGHPKLINALAKLYGPLLGRKLDPESEILVTVGAYESLYCCAMGLINEGDEVILIEPFFDCYVPFAKMAGAKTVCVSLRAKEDAKSSADFCWDENEIRNAFNAKTKCILLNTPHNPTGKVFSRKELELIAELCIKHDVICITDEVYEWLIYSGSEHTRIATLPGMYDRTITVGSAGKTFSVTGWKVGWSMGPSNLIKHLRVVHTNSIYHCSTITQEAVANAIETESERLGDKNCYFRQLPKMLERKRDKMAVLLKSIGVVPIIPEGGYFMMADVSPLGIKFNDGDDTSPYDYKFSRWLIKQKGIACIPPSAFYSKEHKDLSKKFIRFCFIKNDTTMTMAEEKFNEWARSLKK
ncbi:Kynurenine--oxoglutarate transaminase 3 [Trichoplax sp. H2]|uniref:Aminotransferase class I/classII large domain-containing protein n=1 Tax=Trichoplax adhaerens TaxID=10228 RepID=B3RNG4_TRIAD|nr:hypothetical protein TRIADDRAFT_20976 [Trichoplax adhaerens]EDV27448.1 hypothetical protein TRIADDRAFT_20976 [Trichoplax adhaerens]RDD44439.1 Kynurenine--oxoglutarate transaminase 3 [Trichoplax sp. H2]|eukprot:XP_002109282.1 hypothetical protein TRIADDRAFT_20976 [Trichoplax adhaerens]